MEIAAPSWIAPSFSVFTTGPPETVIVLPALMRRLPAQPCTPMVLALMVEFSMVSVPLLGK